MSDSLQFRFGEFRTSVSFLSSPRLPQASLVVLDENTAALFPADTSQRVVLPAGETSKSWQSVQTILTRCTEIGVGRDGTVAGVGGGVVCDVAAFAASIYMRGCSLVLTPTTLLAMVDASLGGKTGIDFLGYKNLVGTFYPAARIEIAVGVLGSLSEREYRSGLAEVIKTGIIGDPELFRLLETEAAAVMRREPALLQEMIRRCLAVKGAIVEEDLREDGRRALLNLGHTFAHALESASRFAGWTHGEAVAWGMARAVDAGERLRITPSDAGRRILRVLEAYGYRLRAPVGLADLLPAFERDKKRRAGRHRLVLAKGLGHVMVQEVSSEDLAAALEAGSEDKG